MDEQILILTNIRMYLGLIVYAIGAFIIYMVMKYVLRLIMWVVKTYIKF